MIKVKFGGATLKLQEERGNTNAEGKSWKLQKWVIMSGADSHIATIWNDDITKLNLKEGAKYIFEGSVRGRQYNDRYYEELVLDSAEYVEQVVTPAPTQSAPTPQPAPAPVQQTQVEGELPF